MTNQPFTAELLAIAAELLRDDENARECAADLITLAVATLRPATTSTPQPELWGATIDRCAQRVRADVYGEPRDQALASLERLRNVAPADRVLHLEALETRIDSAPQYFRAVLHDCARQLRSAV